MVVKMLTVALLCGCGDNKAARDDAASDGRTVDAPTDAAFDAAPDALVGAATACDPGRFPAHLTDPIHCCLDGDRTWHTVGSGTNMGRVAQRSYGAACRQADGVTTGCGDGDPFPVCTYGPCGARNEWVAGTNPSYIFIPASAPTVCGWHASGDSSFPEPYTNQTLYGTIDGTCPYRDCLADGTPISATAYALSVTATVDAAATGSLASSPTGISITGAGTAKSAWVGGTTITLTATPTGSASATFSGACASTGGGGAGNAATCDVLLDADKIVTVAYQ